jgi:hypothetical protein
LHDFSKQEGGSFWFEALKAEEMLVAIEVSINILGDIPLCKVLEEETRSLLKSILEWEPRPTCNAQLDVRSGGPKYETNDVLWLSFKFVQAIDEKEKSLSVIRQSAIEGTVKFHLIKRLKATSVGAKSFPSLVHGWKK